MAEMDCIMDRVARRVYLHETAATARDVTIVAVVNAL